MPEVGASEADFSLGRNALLDITTEETIGERLGSLDEGEGVVSVFFATNLSGYPGWRWTASIANIPGEGPSVLETELIPGEGALLAPDWVPWVDRLADYRAAQEMADAAAAAAADDDDADDEDDDDDDDDVLHAGDLDGVDIDEDIDDYLDDHIEDDDLVVADAGVHDPDDADADAGQAGPQPPEAAAGDQWNDADEQDNGRD
jgi:hypothetical protein